MTLSSLLYPHSLPSPPSYSPASRQPSASAPMGVPRVGSRKSGVAEPREARPDRYLVPRTRSGRTLLRARTGTFYDLWGLMLAAGGSIFRCKQPASVVRGQVQKGVPLIAVRPSPFQVAPAVIEESRRFYRTVAKKIQVSITSPKCSGSARAFALLVESLSGPLRVLCCRL